MVDMCGLSAPVRVEGDCGKAIGVSLPYSCLLAWRAYALSPPFVCIRLCIASPHFRAAHDALRRDAHGDFLGRFCGDVKADGHMYGVNRLFRYSRIQHELSPGCDFSP